MSKIALITGVAGQDGAYSSISRRKSWASTSLDRVEASTKKATMCKAIASFQSIHVIKPTEVETALGDPSKAKEKLGRASNATNWSKNTGFSAYDYHE